MRDGTGVETLFPMRNRSVGDRTDTEVHPYEMGTDLGWLVPLAALLTVMVEADEATHFVCLWAVAYWITQRQPDQERRPRWWG